MKEVYVVKMAKFRHSLQPQIRTIMTKNNKKQSVITIDGMMTIGKTKEGLHTADFVSSEYVETEAFTGKCNVQMMRDGNVYITELPKQQRNKPMFRQDHSSLSKGQNGRYYFVFTLPEELAGEIPETLVREAKEAARKFTKAFLENKGGTEK